MIFFFISSILLLRSLLILLICFYFSSILVVKESIFLLTATRILPYSYFPIYVVIFFWVSISSLSRCYLKSLWVECRSRMFWEVVVLTSCCCWMKREMLVKFCLSRSSMR